MATPTPRDIALIHGRRIAREAARQRHAEIEAEQRAQRERMTARRIAWTSESRMEVN